MSFFSWNAANGCICKAPQDSTVILIHEVTIDPTHVSLCAAGHVSFSAVPVSGPFSHAFGHPAVYAIAPPDAAHPLDILVRNDAGVYKCVLAALLSWTHIVDVQRMLDS